MISKLFAFLCRFPILKRLLWRRWYQFLASRYRVPEWQTMNYGYAPIPETARLPLDPADESERFGIQLYEFVTRPVPLTGLRVLEVGCGRGGGAFFLHRTLHPAEMTAVDFSEQAITLSKQRYPEASVTFLVGDAEHLPFSEGSFDAIVNVESSHCYGSMPAFLREVARVLTPGGHFLYADFRDREKLKSWREELSDSGLKILHEANITPNVLAALDADNVRKLALMEKLLPKRLLGSFRDFAATKGSLVYEEFRSGGMQYFHFVLRKP